MRIWPQCIPCIINARMREIINSSLKREEKIEAGRKLLELMLKEINPEVSTIELASKGFRFVKKILKSQDPYKDYKRFSNQLVMRILPKVKSRIRAFSGYERFKYLTIIAINANSLDPGAPPFPTRIDDLELERILFQGRLTIDETSKIYRALRRSRKIVFMLDNAGEAIIDLLLVSELYQMGLEITVIAKSGAYQNDITVEEAIDLGFGEYAKIVGTGSDYGGPLLYRLSDEAKRSLKSADIIIAKGMANYEALLYTPLSKPVAHLFKAKCTPVASTLGVKKGANVAILKG